MTGYGAASYGGTDSYGDTVRYVEPAALAALLAPAAGRPDLDERIALACDAANRLIAQWTPQDLALTPAPADNPVAQQAALELAHTLYRRHAATGGFLDVDQLVARLPASLVASIRDELDAVTGAWGLA